MAPFGYAVGFVDGEEVDGGGGFAGGEEVDEGGVVEAFGGYVEDVEVVGADLVADCGGFGEGEGGVEGGGADTLAAEGVDLVLKDIR